MPNTTFNALPYPAATDAPYVHLDMKALADAVDERLPIVSTTAPPHRAGRQWFNPATRRMSLSDGTAWFAVTEDTGWQALTLESGATVVDAHTPRIRRVGGLAFLTGRVQQGGSYLVSIPAGFRRDVSAIPTGGYRYAAVAGSSGFSGNVLAYTGAHLLFTTAGQTINLDGISWPVDPSA